MKKTLYITFALIFSSLSAMDDAIRRERIEQKIGDMVDTILRDSELPEAAEIQSLAREACVVIPSVGALTSLLLYNTPEGLSGRALDLVETFEDTFIQYAIDILR